MTAFQVLCEKMAFKYISEKEEGAEAPVYAGDGGLDFMISLTLCTVLALWVFCSFI